MCGQCIYGKDIYEIHARLRGLLTLYQIDISKKKVRADEITEPRPDMNIKVTAFTVIKKLYYTIYIGGIVSCQQESPSH